MKTHVIWENDICSIHDDILNNPEYYDENNEIDDTWAWEYAQTQVDDDLDDQVRNLNIDKKNNIFLIGNYERWNGSYDVHKDLETNNIGEAIKKAVENREDGSCRVYVEGRKLLISWTGHDNPVNPSVMEFRVFKDCDDLDEFEDRFKTSDKNLMRHSVSVAGDVRKVFGW